MLAWYTVAMFRNLGLGSRTGSRLVTLVGVAGLVTGIWGHLQALATNLGYELWNGYPTRIAAPVGIVTTLVPLMAGIVILGYHRWWLSFLLGAFGFCWFGLAEEVYNLEKPEVWNRGNEIQLDMHYHILHVFGTHLCGASIMYLADRATTTPAPNSKSKVP